MSAEERKKLRKKFRKLYRFENILSYSDYEYWSQKFEKWIKTSHKEM